MGGYGSGQYGFVGAAPKKTVEQCLELSITKLKPNLVPWQKQVRVKFWDRKYALLLDWTDCNYGKQRPWFLCPRCQRRAGKLYQRSLQGSLGCRQCHNLTYRSCQITKGADTLNLQYQRLKKKLGAKDFQLSRLDAVSPKPKKMHGKTYERICREIEVNELRFLGEMNRRMLKLCQRLTPGTIKAKVGNLSLGDLLERQNALDQSLELLLKDFDL